MEFIFGIVVLALNIWALVNVWQSGTTTAAKVLWTLGIVIAPIIGFIVWFLFGPKSNSRATA